MAVRDECMTNKECEKLVFRLCRTLYRFGLYQPTDRIPSEHRLMKFTEEHRLYTKATDGIF